MTIKKISMITTLTLSALLCSHTAYSASAPDAGQDKTPDESIYYYEGERVGPQALNLAINAGNEPEALRLINAGADVHLINPEGQIPLMAAVNAGLTDVIQALVAHGANIHTRSGQSITEAVLSGDATLVEVLLNEGADVNIAFSDGMTLLHYAVYHSVNPEVVRILRDRGANLDAVWSRYPQDKPKTPLELAYEMYIDTAVGGQGSPLPGEQAYQEIKERQKEIFDSLILGG